MANDWLIQLLQRLRGRSSPPSRPPLTVALGRYQQALNALEDTPATLLSVLLVRDQVEAAMRQDNPLPTDQVQQLLALDKRLRKETTVSLLDLSDWRKTFHPPDAHWWWFLDQAAEKRREEKDLPWIVLTGTFMALAFLLALSIIERLWTGTPDTVAVFGTLLTALVTSSPLNKRGRELVQWLLKWAFHVKPRIQAQILAATAGLALALLLISRLILLPWLAECFNDRGYEEARRGNLTLAQRSFQHAVALDPDFAVGYYHLGTIYEDIARYEESITWYQQAIEHDLELSAAYNNLGRLYLLQKEPDQAVQVLHAGLKRIAGDTETDQVTRYRLLSNLGWAYYALEQPTYAREMLEQAVELENELDVAFKYAVPHYYLALTFEALEQPDAALAQWEDSLRYVDAEDPVQIGWDEIIYEHLEKLREGKQ